MPVGENQGAEPGRPGTGSVWPRGAVGRVAPGHPRTCKPFWVAGVVGVLLAGAALLAWSRRATDPDWFFREARAALDAGQPDRAAEAVRQLQRLREPTPFDRLLRAQVDEARRRPDEAMAELLRIEAPHP